jgi:hypothetical protein
MRVSLLKDPSAPIGHLAKIHQPETLKGDQDRPHLQGETPPQEIFHLVSPQQGESLQNQPRALPLPNVLPQIELESPLKGLKILPRY